LLPGDAAVRTRIPTIGLAATLALGALGCDALFGEERQRGRTSDDDITVPDLSEDAGDSGLLDVTADGDAGGDASADGADAEDAGGDGVSDDAVADASADVRDAQADAEPDGDASLGDADADAGYVPGPLEDRTRLFVCGKWDNDRTRTVDEGWTAADGPACDPGIMAEGAEGEALTTLALYHWLVGLNAVAVTSEETAAAAIQCATLLAEVGEATYDPPDGGTCWSSEAEELIDDSVVADGAANPAEAIDAALSDTSDNTFYARRALLDPRDVTTYGVAQVQDIVCTYVSDVLSGNAVDFAAYPNPGWAPMLAQTPWTIIGGALRFDVSTTVEVVRVRDGADVRANVRLVTAPPGNGTLVVTPEAWDLEETYEVRIQGANRDGTRENVRYRTTPTTCVDEPEE
jgi:hypothetical protein